MTTLSPAAAPPALDPPPAAERPAGHARVGEFLADAPPHKLTQLRQVLRLEPRAMVLIFLGTVAASLIALVQPLLAGRIVAVLESTDLWAATPYALALAGLAMATSGLSAAVNLLGERAGNRTVQAFRDEAADLSMRVPADKLVDHPAADLVARCSIDSEHLNEVFSRGPIQALGGVVLVLGALVQMTVLDPILTVAALVLTLGCLTIIIVASRRLTSVSFARQEAQGAYVAELTRALDSVLTLRAFVADAFAARRLRISSRGLLDAANRTARTEAFMGPLIAICLQVTLLLIVVVAVLRVQVGHLGVEQLVSFIMYTVLIVGPIVGSADTIMSMARTLGALQRLIELQELTRPAAAPTDAAPVPAGTSATTAATRTTRSTHTPENTPSTVPDSTIARPALLRGDVDFRNVSVRHRQGGGSREYALSDVTFSVPAGSWVALTGSSGSGKSTVLSLLEKFVTPTEGLILVDGLPLGQHEDDAYRRQVGYIEQACPLFSGTVRDNLLLGRDIDDDRCWSILDQVGLAETIHAREAGLDTPVGESAYAFSGGERQRLTIARTLLGDPRMLLLDEITSGLDPANRDRIVELIRTTMGGLTTFAASHGGVGLAYADHVLVLDQGRLVDHGHPDEVRERSPLFRSLIERG